MQPKTNMTDAAILDGLRAGGSAADASLAYLYWQCYPMIVQHILHSSGSEEEAQDIFQEGMITFYEQVSLNKYREQSAVKTYVFAICKNRWLNHLKRKRVASKYTAHEARQERSGDSPEDIMLEKEKHNIIMMVLEKLGDTCREILRLRLYERLPMDEVAQQLGYKNEQNARNKHYKCKQELKKLVAADPLIATVIPFVQ